MSIKRRKGKKRKSKNIGLISSSEPKSIHNPSKVEVKNDYSNVLKSKMADVPESAPEG